MPELKTIKVNNKEYETLIKAKEELILRGVNSLPENYRGIVKQEVQQEVGKFTNGLIVALGAILLAKLLSEKKR